jgi:putative N6-adenine-specific DNA methylase
MFAVCPPGLEGILLAEVRELGIVGARAEEGGVGFSGGMRELYRANLHLRTAARVLVRVANFHASAFHELERNARKVKWDQFMDRSVPILLRVTCRKSRLYHSDAVAERIVNVLGSGALAGSADGDEDEAAGSQLLVVRLVHDECSISLGSSGGHLHKRGYREELSRATMRETLAAALLQVSGWDLQLPLLDPMCGSGTIAIEAALMVRRIAPGLSRASREPRSFSFEQWPSHNPAQWGKEVAIAQESILDRAPARIFASDRDAGAVEIALRNARRAGVEADIEISQRSLSAVERLGEGGVVVVNPPYGKRVGEEKALRNLYASLGKLLRGRFAGWELALLSGNAALDKHIGVKLAAVAQTTNGGIAVRIVRGAAE